MPAKSTTEKDPAPGVPPSVAVPLLLERHGDRLYSLGLKFCGNSTDAADLVQETFLRALRSWPTFRGDAAASTWLYRIAARVCQRMHRRPARASKLPDPRRLLPLGNGLVADVPDTAETPLEREIGREMVERVEESIAGLPMMYRVPLVLKEIVGFSVAEVADILGLREATVKTRLHRARLSLRKAVDETLPHKDAPPTPYSQRVCFDLLRAKQDALDRGVSFPLPPGVLCERCRVVFQTMDLARDVCAQLAGDRIPEELRARIEGEIAREGKE